MKIFFKVIFFFYSSSMNHGVFIRTSLCGNNSVFISAVNAWNETQTTFEYVILKNLTSTEVKTLLTKCINKY